MISFVQRSIALLALQTNTAINDMSTLPSLSQAEMSPSISRLVTQAKDKFQECFSSSAVEAEEAFVVAAPGRVNLIGEHTDYTGGFVLPLAIDYSTVVYGVGTLSTDDSGASTRSATIKITSCNSPSNQITMDTISLTTDSTPPEKSNWTTYVAGTVFQYLPDLPESNSKLELTFAVAGDIPIASGLSSSASLEVATARFVECILKDHAFSSEPSDEPVIEAKVRALRCQKAENTWCNSPCGIMDQYVSSAANEGTLLLIDCRSLDYEETKMADTGEEEPPVLVVSNSNVQHDIAGGEYPVRVAQCKTAKSALAKSNPQIKALRDATLEDVTKAQGSMDEISYKRAKHVVTENARTCQAKVALEMGDWVQVGNLMNDSHTSMRDDYEVSCTEVDMLVSMAQQYEGVYGSRLTGGGFGGCTVTLVKKSQAQSLMDYLNKEYKEKTGTDCSCFVTTPSMGARVIGVDKLSA